MSHPNAQTASAETSHQHAAVGLYGYAHKVGLKLMRIVMQHLGLSAVVVGNLAYKSEFHHQLASVANTQ